MASEGEDGSTCSTAESLGFSALSFHPKQGSHGEGWDTNVKPEFSIDIYDVK